MHRDESGLKNKSAIALRAEQIEIVTLVVILALAAFLPIFLWRTGQDSRHSPSLKPRVYLLNRESDAYAIWQSFGIKGRTIIHFGRHLPMKQVPAESLRKLTLARQGDFYGLLEVSKKELAAANYLYAASRANFVRQILAVVPDEAWSKVKNNLNTNPVFSVGNGFADVWIDGLPLRTGKLRTLPAVPEPVILNFSADYFVDTSATPEGTISGLRTRGVRFDVVTITPPPDQPKYKTARTKIGTLKALLESAE